MLKDPLTAWGHGRGRCYGGGLRFETCKLAYRHRRERPKAGGKLNTLARLATLRSLFTRVYGLFHHHYHATQSEYRSGDRRGRVLIFGGTLMGNLHLNSDNV